MKDQYSIFLEALQNIENKYSTYQCNNHFFGLKKNGTEVNVSVSLVMLKSGHFQLSIIEREKKNKEFLAQYDLYGEIILKENLILLSSESIPSCSSNKKQAGKIIFLNQSEIVLDLSVRNLLYIFNTPIKLYKTISKNIQINGENFSLNINQTLESLC